MSKVTSRESIKRFSICDRLRRDERVSDVHDDVILIPEAFRERRPRPRRHEL